MSFSIKSLKMYGQVKYMPLQRLNSPHKLKGWYLQGPARLQQIESSFSLATFTLIVYKTFAALKQTENSRTGEGSGGGSKWVTAPLVWSLRYSGKWGGRGKLEVSLQRPIRAALPPSLHMRGSWDMYLQYPSLYLSVTHAQTQYTPRGLLYKTDDARPLWLLFTQFRMRQCFFRICTYGRNSTHLKKAWEINTTELHSKHQRSFHFTSTFNLINGATRFWCAASKLNAAGPLFSLL